VKETKRPDGTAAGRWLRKPLSRKRENWEKGRSLVETQHKIKNNTINSGVEGPGCAKVPFGAPDFFRLVISTFNAL